VTDPSPAGARVSCDASSGRPTEGRRRLLAATERLFATRGLGVPNREIVAAAGHHNRSAITYHFASRAGLIEAVRERHETPIAQHRQHLIARLPGPEDRTTRQLVEAHIQPLAAEMLRCAPSYWARLSEMLLMDEPLRFSRDIDRFVHPRPQQRADMVLSELLELMVAHLSHLPEPESVGRVALTVRFLNSGLARWERDSEIGVDGVEPLTSFTLILTDLAVAMLDAPGSVPTQIDLHLRREGVKFSVLPRPCRWRAAEGESGPQADNPACGPGSPTEQCLFAVLISWAQRGTAGWRRAAGSAAAGRRPAGRPGWPQWWRGRTGYSSVPAAPRRAGRR
jgi:AcrR family transcriptional regulator